MGPEDPDRPLWRASRLHEGGPFVPQLVTAGDPIMEPLETRPLFRYRAELASPQQDIGATYAGRRTIALVTGGEVQGERIRGKVLNGGGDWASVDEKDRLRLDVRLTIETHDAALIYVRYAGV